MLAVIAVLLAFASVFLVVVGLRTKQLDPVEARLRNVQAGLTSRNPTLQQPFIQRAAIPMAGGIVRLIMKLLPSTWITATQQRLIWAGRFMSLPGFILVWTAVTGLFAVVFYVFADSFGVSIILKVIAVVMGFVDRRSAASAVAACPRFGATLPDPQVAPGRPRPHDHLCRSRAIARCRDGSSRRVSARPLPGRARSGHAGRHVGQVSPQRPR